MGAHLANGGAEHLPASSRQKFFSRFSIFKKNTARNISDFHIRIAEPYRQYSAGDRVRGAVILTVVKPIRITHLTVALHGFVRVYKSIAERGSTNPPLGGRSTAQYHGNGLASLFQDEQVLSGDGRLEASKWEFEFDLQLPEKGLPSNIDFERGTISYMVTATLTRPSVTPLGAVTTCDQKITLVEKIDIGILPRPRARTITLEPISKRSKRRRPTGTEKTPPQVDITDHVSDRESAVDQLSVSDERADDSTELARSPVQHDVRSEVSGDSITTGSNVSDRGADAMVASTLAANSKLQAVNSKTIFATIEMLKGGAMAGDTATVKVSVQHIKRYKSMHGIIVTLFRQSRIDSAPPASMFGDALTKEDVRKMQKDELYPRSKTGLGGLSLSSASSVSVFRKDLSQSVAPLIIDPRTMETTVTASVKVPEESFPTISTVPGEMIGFKYHVEVIVDLGGRLANHLQSGPQSARGGLFAPSSTASESNNYMARGGDVLDTERLRREKGVISVKFELVVGTTDSTRGRGRADTLRTFQVNEEALSPEEIVSPWSENGDGHDGSSWLSRTTPTRGVTLNTPFPLNRQQSSATVQPRTSSIPQAQGAVADDNTRGEVGDEEAPAYVPPPQIVDENTLTDKERARRQEERLLPSQPQAGPSETEPSGSAASASEPNLYDADDQRPSAPPDSADAPSTQQPSSLAIASGGAGEGSTDGSGAEPSAPTMDDLAGPSTETTDDKQEMERRRLLNEASAPPEFPSDYDAGPSNSSGPTSGTAPSSAPTPASASASAPAEEELSPSAPDLGDEDDYGAHYSYREEAGPSGSNNGHHGGGPEPLPRYER